MSHREENVRQTVGFGHVLLVYLFQCKRVLDAASVEELSLGGVMAKLKY